MSEVLCLKFLELVTVFEKIDATTKRLEMTDLLVELIKKTPPEEIRKVVYLLQGKLYPDYEGVELGLAEKLLIKAVDEVTGRTEKAVEGDYRKTGDLGSTVEKMVQKRSQMTLSRRPLTVGSVYGTFDKIAHASGARSVETKVRLLTSLLNDASPLEAKYIARMAVGKLRLGVADMTVLDALAVAYGGDKAAREPLERAYNLSSDLGSVAEVAAKEGLDGIRRFKISLGHPIRPMLCERLPDAGSILEKMGGTGAAEYKYDGLRLQIHVGAGKVRLFSRRLENITNQFPDIAQNLRTSIDGKEAIVEGECVAVDPNTGDMLPFQVISQRRGRKYELTRIAEEIPVTAFLFDILYVNGRDLTLMPYPDRRKQLLGVVKPSEHVALASQTLVKDPEKLEHLMDEAVAAGCEGLVVKNVSDQSIYQAGARGWLWIKYKRSYKSEVQDTFDLAPVGAFAGRGRRAGTYGALLMAVYNPKDDAFETICKLGSGFTDEDLANLPRILDPYRTTHRNPRVNSLIEADLWFTPSLVLEVAADEITLSPLHTCGRGSVRPESGLALRFPRFTGKWRKDKSAQDATTSQETLEMYKKQLKQIEAQA
ncbi:MAG TPA: ATP-dependent DNA ligase [Candidatus Dormibacteraeota bacterium]|nr:ATP-dependent DNA ligase [Candidatus Dormibacteraeota bacterium]